MANGTDYVGAVLDRLEQLCDACIDRARKLAMEDGAILQEQVTQARKRLRGTDGISFPMRPPLADRNENAEASDDVPRKSSNREGAADPANQPMASRNRTPADLLCEAQAMTHDFSFKDLQRELKSRGIKAVGKKHELKERLDRALAEELGTEQAAAHEMETDGTEALEVEQSEKSETKTTEPLAVQQEPPRSDDMAMSNSPDEVSAKSAEPSAELSTDNEVSKSEPVPTAPSSKAEPLKVGILKWLPQTLGIMAATVPLAPSVPSAAPMSSPASATASVAAPVAAPAPVQVAAPAPAEAPGAAPTPAQAVAPSAAPAASPSDVSTVPAVAAPAAPIVMAPVPAAPVAAAVTMPVPTLAAAPTAEPETLPAPASAPSDTESGNIGSLKSNVRQVIAMHEAAAHRQQQPWSKPPRSVPTAVDVPKEGTTRGPVLAPGVGQQAQSVKLNGAGIGGRIERGRLEEVRARQEKERELKREQQLNKERVQQERLINEKKRKEAEEAIKKAAAIKRHEEAEARRRLKEDEERRRLHALAAGKIPMHTVPAPASGMSSTATETAAAGERVDADWGPRENAAPARSQPPVDPAQPNSAPNRLASAVSGSASRDVPHGVQPPRRHHIPSTHVMQAGLAPSAAMLVHNTTGGRPAPVRPASPPAETYEISDHEGSTDDEEDDSHANKYVPAWACGANLREALKKQADQDPSQIFNITDSSCDLGSIFRNGKSFKKRTSSQNWGQDLSTYTERQKYRVEMGFTPPKT